ncbi:hypothetical protein MMC22_002530 [Lobaria immixta]|nr:hypothetical protein [Lobaria immixta]
MGTHDLIARSRAPSREFNWIFLVYLLVIGILTLWFLFFFNRLFARLVSYTIRTYTWHRYRVYVDIQALQFSLLGGRVFFKGFRYHGHNETVLIHDGYITWRYWLRRVRQVNCNPWARATKEEPSHSGLDINADEQTTSGETVDRKVQNLPCRIVVEIRGLEWFIYNRSPAYDAILKSMANEEVLDGATANAEPVKRSATRTSSEKVGTDQGTFGIYEVPPSTGAKRFSSVANGKENQDSDSMFTPASTKSSTSQENEKPPVLPGILRILPVRIDCNKGAIVMGNQNTRSILTAKFDGATGHLDARDSRSMDKYKQVIDFEFTHPVIQFKNNRDFKGSLTTEGARHKCGGGQREDSSTKHFVGFGFRFKEEIFRSWGSLRFRFAFFRGSEDSLAQEHSKLAPTYRHSGNDATLPGQGRWLGLTRYLDDDDELVEQERWKATEYGQYPTVVDSPKIAVSFYWDVPGLVPISSSSSHRSVDHKSDDINGDFPPDWGVDLRIFGGAIRYGPWADRQRADLQAVFFPSLHKDGVPARRLRPGTPRMSTVFKLVLEIEDQTTLGIPTREESKDWKWRGRETARIGTDLKEKGKRVQHKSKKEPKIEPTPDIRSFGWLDIKVFANSTMSFAMDLVAKEGGFSNQVNLDLRGPEISTSVNHGLLWRSKSQKISCNLFYPLKWNALHPWHIDIQGDEPELFILRDHIFLLTDLVSDWASGPPGDFHTFIPYHYTISLHFNACKIYLNANDSNIINNPSDIDDNTFIVLWGKELAAAVEIPLKSFRPTRNQVTFDADVCGGGMQLLTPAWNTYHTFLSGSDVAVLKDLRLNGSYDYFSSTLPGLTDIMVLNIHGVSLRVEIFGFLVRYLMKIKDNYFGDDLHFRTVEEYQEQSTRLKNSDAEYHADDQHTRLSNDLDVILGVTVENPCVILPSHLYSATDNIVMDMSSLGLDLRFTNYYMDLAITFSPVTMSHTSPVKYQRPAAEPDPGTKFFIDGMQILGHRLFGLPPTEPTYVCNWDFDIGSITGEFCADFMNSLILALRCFGFVFEDAENALPCSHLQMIHDVTFLRVKIRPVDIWLRLEQTAFLFRLQEARISYQDLAGKLFSEHLHVSVPTITAAIVDAGGQPVDSSSLHSSTTTAAYFETSVDASMVKRKLHSNEGRQLQQSHFYHQDSRTHRIPWLVQDYEQSTLPELSHRRSRFNPPAMPFPTMPEPVLEIPNSAMDHTPTSSGSVETLASKMNTIRKSSFLSNASLRQGRTKRRYSSKGFMHHYGESGVNQDPLHPAISSSPDSADNGQSLLPYNTSTSRPSALYDTQERHPRKKPARPDLTFSSPYKKPRFSLSGTRLDLDNVPAAPNHVALDINKSDIEIDELQHPDHETEQISFMIHLRHGLRAFCMPMALLRANDLLVQMQSYDPVTLLDILQIETMTDEVKSIQKQKGHRIISEVRLTVPYVEARLTNFLTYSDQSMISRQHQYNLSLQRLLAIGRSSQIPADDEKDVAGHQLLGNLNLGQITCSAKEFQKTSDVQAIVQLSVYDSTVWMLSSSAAAVDIRFRGLDVITASREVDSLTALLQQTIILLRDINHTFLTRKDEETPRVRLLVLLLTENGVDIPDPPFLTKASQALRSATSHPRTINSWKMMSRLRYVHKSCPNLLQDEINAQGKSERLTCPEDAGSRVIASLDDWDEAHIRQSRLVQKVYGPLISPSHGRISQALPVKASIRAGSMNILIDPGPNKSAVILETLVVNAAVNQPWAAITGHHTGEPSIEKGSVVQACCAQTTIDINWDLCQYLQKISEFSRSLQSELLMERDSVPSTNVLDEKDHLHIIISSQTNILKLKSINLELSSVYQDFKSSIIRSMAQSPVPSIHALITINETATDVRSHSRLLAQSKLYRASVFGSTGRHNVGFETNRVWKFAGSCEKFTLEIPEDPLGLLEIAAAILREESVQVSTLIDSLKPPLDSDQSSLALPKSNTGWKAHVSLFLGSYLISFTLLPSLLYSISGTAAQGSMQPGRRNKSELIIDFDIQNHFHILTMQDREHLDEFCTLKIPPINGRLDLDLSCDKISVVLHILIEDILLDASMVHALLATLSRPEIGSLFNNIAQDFSVIQTLWRRFFPSSNVASQTSSIQDSYFYNAHVSFSGLIIQASTSKLTSTAGPVRLQLHSGCILLEATNKLLEQGRAMKFPELKLRLKDMKFDLSKIYNSELHSCGHASLSVFLEITSKGNDENELVRAYVVRIHSPFVNLYAETASMGVDMVGHLQDTLKKIDLSKEVRGLRRLTRARLRSESILPRPIAGDGPTQNGIISHGLFSAMYSLEVSNVCVTWKIGAFTPLSPGREAEDLILSFTKIDLATKRDNAARLSIEDFQLQMAPSSKLVAGRSQNSALLPEVVFNVAYLSTATDRRLAFQAAGKSLDLRLTSHFILPASDLRRSIAIAVEDVRKSTDSWNAARTQTNGYGRKLLGEKRLASLLIDADFAGAVVHIQGQTVSDPHSLANSVLLARNSPQHGRYGQFTSDNASSSTTLRAPGIALKVEYKDAGSNEPSLNAEIKVDASSNVLYPTVVPLVMEISSSIKEIVGESENNHPSEPKPVPPKPLEDEGFRTADPSTIFRHCRLNLGLRVCRQEFSLSCQPIARVAATARFDTIYVTLNTLQSNENGQFFTLSATFDHLQASVQHVYSRESTGSFVVDSIFLCLMNSKHISTVNGLSAILKISPMKVQVNAKQLHDFLLFREIWVPPDLRQPSVGPAASPSLEPQAFIVQRYQQVAAAGAFPWNATVSIAELDVQLDLGQSLGKSAFIISKFWVSTKKSSDWEQNLCLGFEKVGVDSTGRMSGYIELQNFRVRTSIHWAAMELAGSQAPLIQASLGFDHLRVKAGFDFQAFLIADITNFEFLMYNVRDDHQIGGDRLVGVVDGGKVQVFCTTTSAAQGLSLYQTVDRLIQDKQAAYEASLKDMEKFLRRKSSVNPFAIRTTAKKQESIERTIKAPLQLQTNVVVSLKAVNIGAFPSTFLDNQIFKLEALDTSARFTVFLDNGKLHSTLGMTLGQLRIALSSVNRANVPKSLGEVSVDDVVAGATGSRGGTILKVPRLVASMQTWQTPESSHIDYIFSSSFQGKVDVGWNYSRISFLRGMWTAHARALAQRLGKPLPPSALQITGGLQFERQDGVSKLSEGGKDKITAVVNVPQSKFHYTALQPPIIETPQLRDMGEATPPLEWIGLHRERLPNLTHQIVIVALLEVAKEVEDAYHRILGSS